jgi:hypothetical protein
MNDDVLRKNMVEMLRGGEAHLSPQKTLDGLDPAVRNRRPAEGLHSVYELIEHMRITQEDILRYTLDPGWISPTWPDGYWPSDNHGLVEEIWKKTVDGFKDDLEELIGLVKDRSLDLTAEIPHGEGRTYLREILLVADHNAYHTGQIAQTRKSLGDWPK